MTKVPVFNVKYKEVRVETYTDKGEFFTDKRVSEWALKDFYKCFKVADSCGQLPTERQRAVLNKFEKMGFVKWMSYTQIQFTEAGAETMQTYWNAIK